MVDVKHRLSRTILMCQWACRFVTQTCEYVNQHINMSTKYVNPQVFMPHRHVNMSISISMCTRYAKVPINMNNSFILQMFLKFMVFVLPYCFLPKAFEDNLRKNRNVMSNWIKYAQWEESQKEIQRYSIIQTLYSP